MDDPKYAQALHRLLEVMNELREHCPWDRKQTWESLRHLTIEETYELSEAVLAGDFEEIKKELGDLLLHVVFYAKIAAERQLFDLADIMNGLCDKLIRRHPHVFGDIKITEDDEVKRHWESLKLQESKDGVLAGVPNSLPALVKALRIQEKARGVGFDWSHPEEVWAKVVEEITEFKQAVASHHPSLIENEFGDLLFSLVNYARFLNINPENALARTNRKFIKRFNYLEQSIKQTGKTWPELTLADLEVYWEQAKSLEIQGEATVVTALEVSSDVKTFRVI